MKWFKENWLVALLTGLLILVLTNSVVRTERYKHQINAVSDSITVLKYEYSELKKAAVISAELVSAYEFATLAYQDSLNDTKQEIINQKQRHAKQIADLIRIPSDVLYLDFTRWIDTISFE